MADAPNGSSVNSLLRWLLGGAATLIVLLGAALASDMRAIQAHQSTDIESLQKSQAATAQALEDIRQDLHELVLKVH